MDLKNFVTMNKKIATAPFETKEIKSTISRGVAVIDQSKRLTPLKVLAESTDAGPAGATIYVRGECMKHAWAAEVFLADDGTEFILVPLDMVLGFELPKVELSEIEEAHADEW